MLYFSQDRFLCQLFYVLLIFMTVFLLGVGVMRVVGIPNPETGTFLLNLGLYGASLSAHVIALGMAMRAISDELENRTIYPLLATALSRTAFIVGKWVAAWLTSLGVLLVMAALAWLTIPHLEAYSLATMVQVLVLQVGSLAMLVACTMMLTLFLPKGVALVAGALWFVAGGRLISLCAGVSGLPGDLARIVGSYLPAFAQLNGITRYTDGIGPLGMVEFASLVGYVMLVSGAVVGLCAWQFERRSL